MCKNLGSLKCLKILSLQSNRITRIEGLENLECLEELYLSHNGVGRLENLEHNVSFVLMTGTVSAIIFSD